MNENCNVTLFICSSPTSSHLGDRLTREDLVFCDEHTNFSEEAIKRWFNHFREECPTGKLTKEHLHSLFQKIFPVGESETFCNHIFRIFDNDGNGFLDIKEFLMALDVTQCRSEREKLQWAFRCRYRAVLCI